MFITNPPSGTTSPQGTLSQHDLKVVGFQVGVVVILAILNFFLKFDFGQYNTIAYPVIMIIAEAVRRFSNGPAA